MKKRPQVTIEDLRAAGATVVSLARQPLNLRPAIDVITDILRQRAAASEKAVAAVFAEQHNVAAHIILPMAILSKLARDNPASVGAALELPHNLPDQYLHDEDVTLTREQIAAQIGSNDDGLIALKIKVMLKVFNDHAPLTNLAFQNACLKYGVSVCFADAAQTPCQQYLDPDDPDNAELLATAELGESRDVFMDEGLGMAIRNIVIAKNCHNHMRKKKLKFQLCRNGGSHIFGEPGYDDYTDSLAHIFGKIGINAVYVVPIGKAIKEKYIPVEALNHAADIIVVTGMDERRFKIGDAKRETAHLLRMYYESGFVSAVEYAANKRELGIV